MKKKIINNLSQLLKNLYNPENFQIETSKY